MAASVLSWAESPTLHLNNLIIATAADTSASLNRRF